MNGETRKGISLTVIVAGITLVVSSIGMLIKGAVSLNQEQGLARSERDSLFYNDSLIFVRLARVERAQKIKTKVVYLARPKQVGLGRRFLQAIW